jgi:hypothetical protein
MGVSQWKASLITVGGGVIRMSQGITPLPIASQGGLLAAKVGCMHRVRTRHAKRLTCRLNACEGNDLIRGRR